MGKQPLRKKEAAKQVRRWLNKPEATNVTCFRKGFCLDALCMELKPYTDGLCRDDFDALEARDLDSGIKIREWQDDRYGRGKRFVLA